MSWGSREHNPVGELDAELFATDERAGQCTRCGEQATWLSRDWEECGQCTQDREDWESNTPEWVKLGMSGMWGEP